MKRTCDRCKALSMMQGELPECRLGYSLDTDKIKPLEDCPKPLTNMGLINAEHKFIKVVMYE